MPRSEALATTDEPDGDADGTREESALLDSATGAEGEPEAAPHARTDPDPDTEAALSGALGTVAHGAVVSVPSLLCQRVLAVVFTAVLTNGFAVAAYGVFALAKRTGRLLRRLPYGLQSGLNRCLPVVETPAERDHQITVSAGLFLGVAILFGAGLYLLAPRLTPSPAPSSSVPPSPWRSRSSSGVESSASPGQAISPASACGRACVPPRTAPTPTAPARTCGT